MKQIEKKMIAAIEGRKNFELSNTKVRVNKNGVFVILYNTIIFGLVNGIKYFSDGGWSTVTTSSRLRALGADYSTNSSRNRCELTDRDTMTRLYYYGK